MDKDKKFFLGIIFILLFFMVLVGIVTYKDKKEDPFTINNDAIQFKNEYESLNNVVNENDGKTMKELSIPQDNPVDIINEEEAISLLKSGTGILYMGFAECPWSRSMLPVLLQTLDNMNIDRLYYLNIFDIRDTLVLNDQNKVEISEEGTDGYYEMLKLLDDFLNPYYLTGENDKKIDAKEKRIYAPTVIGIKNGQIVGIHTGTVEDQIDPYEPLTQEQEETLSQDFIDLINQVYDVNCDEEC